MKDIRKKQKQNNDKLATETKRLLIRQLFEKSYYEFFRAAVQVLEPNTVWDFNWHHQYLCDLLQVEAYRIKNNIPKIQDYNINIPPRTSKSLIVSVCFNAWVWACVDPHQSFLCISHTDELAVELATKTKQLIESKWYQYLFPEVQLRPDSQAKSNFKNTAGGSRISFSMGSGVTGFGCDYLIIDDAHKPNQATPTYLEQAIKTFRETLFNRLNNARVGVRIIIGQRVSEGDLSGYIISNNQSNKYKHICIPVEITEDLAPKELEKFYINNCFWYSRFPQESFSDLTDSSYVFATQYLQRPAPLAGGIIKKEWFETPETVPDNIVYHFFIDTAETTNKKRNDASTILVAGIKDGNIYIKEVIEVFLEFVDLKRRIADAVFRYGTRSSMVYIEPKSNGKAIVAALKEETTLNVVELPSPRDSKVTRLIGVTPKLESKRVKLLKGTWNDNIIYQWITFPNAKQDGAVDVLVYAVNKLIGNSTSKLSWYYV